MRHKKTHEIILKATDRVVSQIYKDKGTVNSMLIVFHYVDDKGENRKVKWKIGNEHYES